MTFKLIVHLRAQCATYLCGRVVCVCVLDRTNLHTTVHLVYRQFVLKYVLRLFFPVYFGEYFVFENRRNAVPSPRFSENGESEHGFL